jgi:hypothetical protein
MDYLPLPARSSRRLRAGARGHLCDRTMDRIQTLDDLVELQSFGAGFPLRERRHEPLERRSTTGQDGCAVAEQQGVEVDRASEASQRLTQRRRVVHDARRKQRAFAGRFANAGVADHEKPALGPMKGDFPGRLALGVDDEEGTDSLADR